MDTAYITHTTELRYPHWGTSTSAGLYYPTSEKWFIADGTATTNVYRATPTGDLPNKDDIHGNPVCRDLESCHSYCTKHAESFPWISSKALKFLLFPLLALILGILGLILCLKFCRGRDKKQKDPNRRESMIDKMRRKSSNKPEEVIVINQVTGTAQDPSTGQAVDPAQATAVLAGSAAGAQAGRDEKNGQSNTATTGDDGKGTTGRRAEEGRGRVNFEDGGHPGSESPPSSSPQQQQTTEVVRQESGGPPPAPAGQTEKVETTSAQGPPPQQTEKVEEVKSAPAPGQQDGTSELSTGIHIFDTGSMRGRKRARPETDGNRLNLGFWGR